MKRQIGVLTASLLILSGCGTSQTASGDPGAIFAGAAIGGNVGGAIGGLIGDNNGGWRGGYRGSAIGTIIGTIAGAAIGNAVSAPKQEAYGYRIERTEPYKPQHETYPAPSVFDNLRIRNIRFIDDSRDHVISSGEKSKVIFEIMNEGEQTIYTDGYRNHRYEAHLHFTTCNGRANRPPQWREIHRHHQRRRADKDGKCHHTGGCSRRKRATIRLAGVLTSHRAINKFSESIQTEHRDVENLTA